MGATFEQACAICDRKQTEAPDPWIQHIMFLYGLTRGGYPFDRDDLTLDEWQDIGTLRDEIEMLERGIKPDGK